MLVRHNIQYSFFFRSVSRFRCLSLRACDFATLARSQRAKGNGSGEEEVGLPRSPRKVLRGLKWQPPTGLYPMRRVVGQFVLLFAPPLSSPLVLAAACYRPRRLAQGGYACGGRSLRSACCRWLAWSFTLLAAAGLAAAGWLGRSRSARRLPCECFASQCREEFFILFRLGVPLFQGVFPCRPAVAAAPAPYGRPPRPLPPPRPLGFLLSSKGGSVTRYHSACAPLPP